VVGRGEGVWVVVLAVKSRSEGVEGTWSRFAGGSSFEQSQSWLLTRRDHKLYVTCMRIESRGLNQERAPWRRKAARPCSIPAGRWESRWDMVRANTSSTSPTSRRSQPAGDGLANTVMGVKLGIRQAAEA